MSNSKYVDVVKLSPNCSKPRNHAIDRITPHHTAGVLTEITESEYNAILDIIRNKPTAREGYNYRLKTDLTWEEYELPPIEPEPLTDEESLTRYANELTGASDQTLIEAAETLITDRIKEE